MQARPPLAGLRHVALYARNFEACVDFYTKILGMNTEWRPDADNIYLTSGTDNLALHRTTETFAPKKQQHLDHMGFMLDQHADVDRWYEYMQAHKVHCHTAPKDHRDGARSFYCADPDGNAIQMISLGK